jgi:hypothetical protein
VLSTLLKKRNALFQQDSLVALHETLQSHSAFLSNALINTDYYFDWINQTSSLRTQIEDYHLAHKKILADVISQIAAYEAPSIELSNKIYENYVRLPVKELLNFLKMFEPVEEIQEVIKTRIGMYVDWQYPCLEVEPKFGIFTKYLTSCEPLYLLMQHREMAELATESFNEIYKRRIAIYYDEQDAFLPKNAIGFIFAWDVFTVFSLAEIKLSLEKFFSWTKPGGTVLVNYNDCDNPMAAEFFERSMRTYVTNDIMIQIAKDIGFEIKYNGKLEHQGVTWLELAKPGVMTKIKLASPLGIISDKILTTL